MTQEKSYAHSTQWGMEQTQGVPAGWSVMRSGEWISFQRPDGWTQSVTPNEPQYSRGETLFMLLDAMLSAAPQAQPVEAEQATSETPEKTPTGYSRPPNGEPAHPEDWNAGYEAGLADGHEIGADAGRLPVAWMYEHDGCNDEPILTAVRWPECREPWNETPLDALALAKHAIEKVWLDAVGTGNGEHSISEAARARVEFAADALKLGLRLPDALRKTGVESPLPKPAQPVEAEQAPAVQDGEERRQLQHLIDDIVEEADQDGHTYYRIRDGADVLFSNMVGACARLLAQPAQPVRGPMSWDLFVAACEAEYGEEFCPNNLGDVSDEEKAELMRVVSIVERHHGIGSKGGA